MLSQAWHPGPSPTFPTWKQPWTVFSEAGTGLGTRRGLTISPPYHLAGEEHGVREGVRASAPSLGWRPGWGGHCWRAGRCCSFLKAEDWRPQKCLYSGWSLRPKPTLALPWGEPCSTLP